MQALPDFEYRVWTAYQLSADDFGVMRAAAVALQADHDALAERPASRVVRALRTIIDAPLLVEFDHQGQAYVCQLDWQSFQKVSYPRPTNNPLPPPDVLGRCDGPTQELFRLHPGGKKKPAPKVPENVPESSEKDSGNLQESSSIARAHAQTATATATAKGSGSWLGPVATGPHRSHATCGRPCVPAFLHAEFRNQLGGSEDAADRQLREWYRKWFVPEGQPFGDDPVKYWRACFATDFPSAAPVRAVEKRPATTLADRNRAAFVEARRQMEAKGEL